MDSRQRVALALDHKEPDRVPIDYWATKEINARLLERTGLSSQEEILDLVGADFRYIDGPGYIGPELAVRADGSIEDHWGVPRVHLFPTQKLEEICNTRNEIRSNNKTSYGSCSKKGIGIRRQKIFRTRIGCLFCGQSRCPIL